MPRRSNSARSLASCWQRGCTVFACAFVLLFDVPARAETINFNDTALILEGIQPRSALGVLLAGQRPDPYREAGMTLMSALVPSDPRLGGQRDHHLHFPLENPAVVLALDCFFVGRQCNVDLRSEPRALKTHDPVSIVQLTLDRPPNRFDLISVRVLSGVLNVGVRFANNSIAVYYLSGPGNWGLPGANGLTRATLEGVGAFYTVDDIVFQASGGTAAAAGMTDAAAPRALMPAPSGVSLETDPLEHDALDRLLFRPVAIDVIPNQCVNRLLRQGKVQVALLGNTDFNVGAVDTSTVRLNGVKPVGRSTASVAVARPLPNGACSPPHQDRFTDLVFGFDAAQVRRDLGNVAVRRFRELELTGTLRDGTLIRGTDLIFLP